VADTLETQWNERLRVLTQAKEEYEKQRQANSAQISAEQRTKIMELASDFPKLWSDPKTLDRDRKRMARLLLEDVTLRREQEVLVQVRFKGGATRQLRLPLPKTAWELKRTEPVIVSEIDRLSDQHNDGEIARLLNQRDWRSSGGCLFTLRIVNRLRRDYHLKEPWGPAARPGLVNRAPDRRGIGVQTEPGHLLEKNRLADGPSVLRQR
jgi:hypothetical protein